MPRRSMVSSAPGVATICPSSNSVMAVSLFVVSPFRLSMSLIRRGGPAPDGGGREGAAPSPPMPLRGDHNHLGKVGGGQGLTSHGQCVKVRGRDGETHHAVVAHSRLTTNPSLDECEFSGLGLLLDSLVVSNVNLQATDINAVWVVGVEPDTGTDPSVVGIRLAFLLAGEALLPGCFLLGDSLLSQLDRLAVVTLGDHVTGGQCVDVFKGTLEKVLV